MVEAPEPLSQREVNPSAPCAAFAAVPRAPSRACRGIKRHEVVWWSLAVRKTRNEIDGGQNVCGTSSQFEILPKRGGKYAWPKFLGIFLLGKTFIIILKKLKHDFLETRTKGFVAAQNAR